MQNVQGQHVNDSEKNPVLAAIDLGSNSFHLIITRIEHHELKPIERIGEKVQLARGLHNGVLDDDAINRGLDCLRRFKQAIDAEQPNLVRIVGTNSLRAAKNARAFTREAKKIFGQSIEIISGLEEARLVYLGVAHTLADDEQARLVIDMGGGSTEFIVGQRFEPKNLESLYMGCVSYSARFFSGGKISDKCFKQAYHAASLELIPIQAQFTQKRWHDCIGSSGTFKAIDAIITANGWSDEGITLEALQTLKATLLSFNTSDDINLPGLKDSRKNLIVAGTAIALAAFEVLGISTMRYSHGALREGVIYDLMGRLEHEDVRERSIAALVTRYGINDSKSARIEEHGLALFKQLKKTWRLNNDAKQQLQWAIRLHEIGLSIAHAQFHRHGEYLIANSDIPGFSKLDQQIVATLVRCHRRKIPLDLVEEMQADGHEYFLKLIIIMRLAILFKYLGDDELLPVIKASSTGEAITLIIDPDWLENHPLMYAELLSQQAYLHSANIELTIS